MFSRHIIRLRNIQIMKQKLFYQFLRLRIQFSLNLNFTKEFAIKFDMHTLYVCIETE